MNILVVGCGKVGSCLASLLAKMGHDVSVVDRDEENFDRLDDDFSGFTIVGVPIDQDILRRAGIEGCDALAAVTSDDNVNVMVSQLANMIFHVPTVITRIYDPKREDVFSHFGLRTICPTNLTVNSVYAMLTGGQSAGQLMFKNDIVQFTTMPPDKQMIGKSLAQLQRELDLDSKLFGLLHQNGEVTIASPSENRCLIESDQLLLSKLADQ